MGNFQELKVWQKSKDLAVYVYKITKEGPLAKDFGLKDQMQRSAVSIPSNIGEGDELDTSRQAIRHFYIAKGSSAELLTQAIIAHKIEYIDRKTYIHIERECESISSMLYKLIQVRNKNIR
ncbi:four helix bundle protein [Carboxylicivirga sp. A043]|uniref:four helix bundle protein n=1 Tax=Carboxylicivirga litoralis TaxID=2816963 RepID=UPI0021CB2EB3|nr:four helix bundle protein [Carboxylicivirga sp. A043]MCU4158064.1 four helix bundle protein [Carboxylicivirga sp. A043]